MLRAPSEAVAATRRLFRILLAALAIEAAIGALLWAAEEWHGPVLVVAVTTYFFAALFGLLLAGQRWPGLGRFIELHGRLVAALLLGTAGALLGFLALPDPVMLLVGAGIVAFFALLGWGIEKGRDFLGG